MDRTPLRRFIGSTALAASLALLSCAAPPATGLLGFWSYWQNGGGGADRYLVVARRGEGYLVQFVDPRSGELEGSGSARLEGRRLVARLGGGGDFELSLNGKNELRVLRLEAGQVSRPGEDEDESLSASFVYERLPLSAVPERATALSGYPASAVPRGAELGRPNRFGGPSLRAATPGSPDSRWVLLELDGEWRIRHREVGYPEAFLKEDPRTLGSFDYGESGKVERAEYRFSAAFSKWNKGLSSVIYRLGEDGSIESRDWVYEAPPGGSLRVVSDDGRAEGPAELTGNGAGLPILN